jgi:CRP-like cAMP-binding protein
MTQMIAPCPASIAPQAMQSLLVLAGGEVSGRRQRVIQWEGRPAEHLMLVEAGWIAGSILLANGARQIVSLYLPGDLIGAEGLFGDRATENLMPVTEAKYRMIPLMPAREIVARDAALSLALLRASVAATLAAKKHTTSIGRTSATARVAGLLVDLAFRLGHAQDSGPCQFECFLNQEQIGDYTGLTSVHVNRTLKRMEEAGLIGRKNSVVIIPDLAALAREGEILPPWAAVE